MYDRTIHVSFRWNGKLTEGFCHRISPTLYALYIMGGDDSYVSLGCIDGHDIEEEERDGTGGGDAEVCMKKENV